VNSRTWLWLAIVIAAGLVLMGASRLAVLEPVENLVLRVTSPVQDALRDASRPLADFLTNLTDVDELTDENQRLREEIDRLTSEVSRLRGSEIRLQQLQQLLQVKETHPEDEYLVANVFAQDPSNLKEVIAIDRGKADGVREGMVVVTEGRSLVGRVTKALDDYAWATLITDPNSAVSAMIQESRAQGVVAGSHSGRLSMEFVRQDAQVNEGDVVLTSGLGGTFPQGILIGRVTEVDRQAQELFQSVSVEPLAGLSRLETVLVLTSFEPAQLEAP
jgi:rod shape-determining protein MreC